MKEFLKKNKYLVTLLGLFLILLIVGFITMKNLFFEENGNKYGDRLAGIKDHEIKEATTNKVKDELGKNEKVKSVDINIEGKIVYITIDFISDIAINEARDIASASLQNFTDNQKEYYDLNYMLTQTENKESTSFPTMGYKHITTSAIVWIKQR